MFLSLFADRIILCRRESLWFNEKHGSIRSQTFMWWIIHKNSLIFSFVSPAIILYCRRKAFIWRLVCPPQMPPSSLQQLVFQPSTERWSLTGPHWHFDQQTMRCFDFPLIWQSGCTVSPPRSAPCLLTRAAHWYFQAVILGWRLAELSKCSWSCHF